MKNIFEKLIKKNNTKTFIIAEISGNHQNSYSKLKKFVLGCIKEKADIIKFQVYKPETITLNSSRKDFKLKNKDKIWGNHSNLFDLYKKAYTPWAWIKKIVKILNKKKFPWFASVFDESSIEFLEKLNCKAYKIASPEITDIPLIEKVSNLKKPIIISTGLADKNDIELAVRTVRKRHNKILILKCTTSYPAKEQDMDLISIKTIKNLFKCPVGFSDHSKGFEASKIASALGVNVFEKHFKMDEDKKSIDNHFSMKLSKLSDYKNNIINVKRILGKKNIIISKSASKNLTGKRSLYVYRNIKKGSKISLANVKSIRPSFGLHPKYLKKIIGKKVKKDLFVGDRLILKHIT